MEKLESNIQLKEINSASREHLLVTAKWAKFIAIVAFIMQGLSVFSIVTGLILGASIVGLAELGGVAISIIISLAVVVLYFFPTYYLYKFAIKMIDGLSYKNSGSIIEEGFENLKSSFKFMGILMIVVLSFYALIFLLGLIAAF